jgi:enoyl-CoA hydratase/carnithine racemase
MEDRVRVAIADGVADVQLVRGDKMNALDDKMFDALIAAGEQVSEDPSVRCVVVSGEGRAFCAGLDMSRFGDMAEAIADPSKKRPPLAERTHGVANRPQKAVWIWRECPVPVIAAVHGVAFGGGFQVCLGADIRIVHPETKLSVMEIKWGLVPDMAGPAIMRRLAREDRIRELTFTGRIFSGQEAEAYGFATRLSETPREDALAMAREIAGKSPSAIREAKRMFNAIGPMADADVLRLESEAQDAIVGRGNQIEAVMAQIEKRAPSFEDSR